MATQVRRLPLTPLQRKIERLLRSTNVFDPRFYLRTYTAVARSGIDPLDHYIAVGEAQGCQPSPYFDPAWYALQVPRLPPGHCLLAHYLTLGDAEGVQPIVGFDPAYVRQALNAGETPALVAFLKTLERGRRTNPNRFFDYDYYRDANPDVAAAGVDPYLHFIRLGADEGRLPSENFSWLEFRERYHLSGTNAQVFRELMLRWRHLNLEDVADEALAVQLMQDEIRASHRRSEDYEAHAAPATDRRRRCDVYAFYLTQYHRVAENDAWWGEGFTEWHNVVRGVPRFVGHYQPRIPGALGFYDLDDARVMPRQVALAKQAGLSGFAFYYYHFGTQRLLEKPLERFLADPSLDVGFFLIWANETWSRRWDGSESDVLLEQAYPPEMPHILAVDLVRHFRDPRYRRIDGRPLLAIYRGGMIPEGRRWLRRLRTACAQLGEDPIIYMAQTFEDEDPRALGFDGALEFPPHKISRTLPLSMPERGFGNNPLLKVWDYDTLVDAALAEPPPPYPLIRTCFPSWDNDSRRQGAASVIHGSTPEKFRRWLAGLVEDAESPGGATPIVCINAWNEWGEGAYLEPDRRFGHAYLNAVQTVLHSDEGGVRHRMLLVGHDAFPAGAQRLLLALGRTLRQDFGVEVAFVLMRADAGYDGLIEEYRGIAETHVAPAGGAAALMAGLAKRGFAHALVNSSASSPLLAALAGAGIAIVQLVHELPEMFEALGAGPLMAAQAQRIRRIIASTPSMVEMLEGAGLPAERIELRPQGQYRRIARLDPATARAEIGAALRPRIVAALGYADHRKGADLFVAAAEAARDARASLLFVWQGGWDPPTRAALEDRMAALVASGHLLLRPNSSEIEALLAAADLLFLPSREDPLPSAAIEAWSCGLPVVAVRGTGGVADLIAQTPDLGTLATGEAPAALLRAIRAGLKMGRSEARADWAADRFDWPVYVRDLLRMLFAPPVIDVAIVGHNHGRFAESRIASIARQTLSPRDIAYFDIASTDGRNVGIAQAAERLGVRVVETPANEGRLFETWEAIAAASDAPYLHIAEGDDWIAPAMLERCVVALEQAPGAAYAFCGVEWIDVEDRVIANHGGYPASVIGAEIVGGGEIAAERLLASDFVVKNPVLTISSVLWRRDALVKLIRDNRKGLGQLGFAFDWLLYLRAAKAGHSAVFVPDLLCRHRQHADSFASRDDMARHIAEIRHVHRMVRAPDAAVRRKEYLASLG